ncbi:alpha/beta fold hydrolase [Brucepastera parasyntrophica]|uniref:alpha/beta hydrolase n=1 Tax=Brucepastera parasyntrophica TaxID=2880008 RepID=UPI00210BF99E|nr:alpha/beta fold hydrolase [Brucepastera parasyntrophica]ULQ58485.1 alpha/beta fold hydrolase [Brucepastera parasyntrophica]
MKTLLKHIMAIAVLGLALASCASAPEGESGGTSLRIAEQGSFAVGGTMITAPGPFDPRSPLAPAGQTYRGDHASVSYQIPENSKQLPLVFLHGAGSSARVWETTPDGREGFANIFLRRGFSVYLVDQPRRGQAGRTMVEGTVNPTPDEQLLFGQFRLRVWPDFYPGVQFPRDEESLNQYFRQMTPNTGAYNAGVIADAVSALFARTGPGILVTHSQGGGPGWLIAMQNTNVRAVASYEPGSGYVFPPGEVPAPMPSIAGTLSAEEIPLDEFLKLTRFPIVIYYGDNIPSEVTDIPGQENWRIRLDMARLWVEAVNRHGGDAVLVHLPEIGIRGNTHFPFSDLNSLEIADLLTNFLSEKKLY